jgi:hypothetical protein
MKKRSMKEVKTTEYFALGADPDKPATGVMRVMRDFEDDIYALEYWNWRIQKWEESENLMRYILGDDLDFWDVTEKEANKIVEGMKKEK